MSFFWVSVLEGKYDGGKKLSEHKDTRLPSEYKEIIF